VPTAGWEVGGGGCGAISRLVQGEKFFLGEESRLNDKEEISAKAQGVGCGGGRTKGGSGSRKVRIRS